MFIQTEPTPNPHSLKFMPGVPVLQHDRDGMEGVIAFGKGADTQTSPLAGMLLEIDGIEDVFFAKDFLTLTKAHDTDWLHVQPLVIPILVEHFSKELPTLVAKKDQADDLFDLDLSNPIVQQIYTIINDRVRPAVAQDGGDISLVKFEDGIVYLKLQGACSGCPSSSATLKSGIENMLRYYVPEVLEVQAIPS